MLCVLILDFYNHHAIPIYSMRKLKHREIKAFPQGPAIMGDKTRIQTWVCLLPQLKLLTTQLRFPNQRKLEGRLREASLSKTTQFSGGA